jgi:hypothetical protein
MTARRCCDAMLATFGNACDDIDAVHRFVAVPGPDGFTMSGGVRALAAAEIAATMRDLR